ncbi:MAG: ABC transporter substrate-binding protein [Treponema sp.]|jgi:branched-chain amino acid transport system substrate-binding protein|nr:ABC transporter substrate-binding protein [Treponema sp.]
MNFLKRGVTLFGIAAIVAVFAACGGQKTQTIKIGFNIPLTGDSPKIGESAKNAGELIKKEINAGDGLDVNGKKYQIEFVYVDNELKPESAIQAAYRLIEQERVLAVVGPAGSGRAIPAGQVNNESKTPMVSPWATNPAVTKDRPYVFRACILDPVQAPAAVSFVKEQFPAIANIAVLYNLEDDYSKTLAELFRDNWAATGGTIAAFDSFGQKDQNFSVQLTRIVNSNAELLYLPDYYNHIALIVPQAKSLGWGEKPILGSDSWGSADLWTLSKGSVAGYYFTDHFAAAGATGYVKEFIDKYQAEFGESPDSVAALSYDSANIILKAIQNAGLTGDLQKDRDAIKDAIAALRDYPGVTGVMTFNTEGDPDKPAVVVQITEDGSFAYIDSLK